MAEDLDDELWDAMVQIMIREAEAIKRSSNQIPRR